MASASWQGGDDALICVDRVDEAPDVRTFWFAAASGANFAFDPGQFLTLEVKLPEGTEWRCFTIASPPTRPKRAALTIKQHKQGVATRWLHETLRPGDRLRGLPVAGRFALSAPPRRPLCLVSAGSGATPMIAIARWLFDLRIKVPVHYIHLGRNESDLLFRDEVAAIAGSLGDWRTDFLLTHAARPTPEVITALLGAQADTELFCCGPAGFMATVRAAHLLRGGAAERYHEESFDAPPLAPPPAAGGETHPVQFSADGPAVLASPGETLLMLALRSGESVLSACRKGICGSCRIRKLSGEVEMHANGGISDDEIAEGDILACCSYARSPLILELP